MIRRCSVLLLAALVAGGALAACSEEQQIDANEAEELVTKALEDAGFTSDDISDVSCPDDAPQREGETFDCTADVDGTTVTFTATQTNDDGAMEVEPTQAVFPIGTVETDIETQYDQATGVAVSADCGSGKAIVVNFAASFECTVTDGTGSATVSGSYASAGADLVITTPPLA